MRFQNLKTGTRLGLAFGLVVLLLISVAVLAVSSLSSVGSITGRVTGTDYEKARLSNQIDTFTRANARRTLELFHVEGAGRQQVLDKIAFNKKVISEALAGLDKLAQEKQERELLQVLVQRRQAYVASFTKVGQLLENGQRAEAEKLLMAETLPLLDQLQEPVGAMAKLQDETMSAGALRVSSTISSATVLVLGLSLVAVLLAIAAAVLITRAIVLPLRQAVKVAQTVAQGDLSSRIESRGQDEIGQLMQALRQMNDSLARMVNQVRQGTDTISTGSNQIAAGNLDLSSRTEEQASALEQTASSLEQITSTVRQNADNARTANSLAREARDVAGRGGEVVRGVVQTMGAIESASRNIEDIIGTIDGIAFQTNILALNAAVEAARAGEQGRGFAVVATEVRSLAQRSAAAAKEIKVLIGESVARVGEGTRLVHQAGATMTDIVTSIARVSDIMGEISSASQEQATGIEQLNQAVSQMDQVTQQNAALVEQAAAASASMQDQASSLQSMVMQFRTGDGAAPRLALAA